jgi:hypothetical protein
MEIRKRTLKFTRRKTAFKRNDTIAAIRIPVLAQMMKERYILKSFVS